MRREIGRVAVLAAVIVLVAGMLAVSVGASPSQPTVTKVTIENCQYSTGTIWHTENIVNSIPTVDLGDGVYEGSISASDVGIGTFQAGVDVQLEGFNKASSSTEFTIAEELPLSLWESPIFQAGISALVGLVALALAALWIKGWRR